MNTVEMLDELARRASADEELRELLLATEHSEQPLPAFCRIARDRGLELYPMEVLTAGEDFYASMRRSTNGGGENSPKLDGEDDFYELFLAAMKHQKERA